MSKRIFIYIFFLLGVFVPSFGEVLLNIPTYKYSIGAAQPTQIANIGIKGVSQVCGVGSAPMPTLAQEPVPTVGTQVRTPNRVRRVSYSKGSYSSSSNPYYSSSYSSYKISNGRMHSYGGSAASQSAYSAVSPINKVTYTHGGQVQVATMPLSGNYTINMFDKQNDVSSEYEQNSLSKWRLPSPKDEAWDRSFLENYFSSARLYEEDGVNYYDEQKLRELWDELTGGDDYWMPGDGDTGITWDELLAWLTDNTEKGIGNSRLPIGDGVWVMMIMCVGYFLYRKRCM